MTLPTRTHALLFTLSLSMALAGWAHATSCTEKQLLTLEVESMSVNGVSTAASAGSFGVSTNSASSYLVTVPDPDTGSRTIVVEVLP